MMRRFILAVAVVAITFSFALSDTHTYKVSKIEKQGDNYVLTVTQEGKFNADEKKFDWTDVSKKVKVPASTKITGGGFGGGKGGGFGGFGKGIEDGFANKQFETVPEGGFQITITTADADIKKGDVTAVSVGGGGKGAGKGAGKGKKKDGGN